MIEKLKRPVKIGGTTFREKINELVDAVNELREETKNNVRIRANHDTLIESLIKQNNIHEKQIDKLQSSVSKMEIIEMPTENVPINKDYITITVDDVLVGGESVREYNGEKIYNYYHLPAYFKEIRDDVAEKGIKLLEIHCLQSSTDGEYAKIGNPTPDKNGCSAWCRCVWEKDGKKYIGAWVFDDTYGSAADCAAGCAGRCAYYVRSDASFRSAVFGLQD